MDIYDAIISVCSYMIAPWSIHNHKIFEMLNTWIMGVEYEFLRY